MISQSNEAQTVSLLNDIENPHSTRPVSFSSHSSRSDSMATLINLDVPAAFRRIFMPLEVVTDKVIRDKLDTVNIFSAKYLGYQHTVQLAQNLSLQEYLQALNVNDDWRHGLLSVQHLPHGNSKACQILQMNLPEAYLDPLCKEVYVAMIYNNINLDSVLQPTGRTTFMLAAKDGDIETMKILQAKSCDVYATDFLGCNALHLAIRQRQLSTIAWLLHANFSPNKKNHRGETAMHMTLEQWFKPTGSLDDANILHMLIEHGADFYALDEAGDTPFHLAARHHDSFPLHLLLDDTDGSLEVPNLFGETILHVAARAGFVTLVKWILDKGMDVNIKDNYEATPLHRASWINNIAHCQLLLDHKDINVNARTLSGRSPLHRAAMEGNSTIVKLLLDKGADINQEDNNGLTPTQSLLKVIQDKATLLILMNHPTLNETDFASIKAHFQSHPEKSQSPEVETTIFKIGTSARQARLQIQRHEERFPTPPSSHQDTSSA